MERRLSFVIAHWLLVIASGYLLLVIGGRPAPSMFCSADLAARIEGAEGRLTESIGSHLVRAKPQGDVLVRHIGGGIAVLAGSLSPMNKMIGLGFHDPPTDDELAAVEREFATRGASLRSDSGSEPFST
jgi:hypothetical protein